MLLGFIFFNLILILTAFHIGYHFNSTNTQHYDESVFSTFADVLKKQKSGIELVKSEAEKSIQTLSNIVAHHKQQLIRLDMLGEHLIKTHNIDDMSFSKQETEYKDSLYLNQRLTNITDFLDELATLENRIQINTEQLIALDTLLRQKTIAANTHPSVLPINAYVSSWYGWRSDPLKKHNRKSLHQGIDFSANIGSSIKSVADGIVSWSGPKDQYGNFIEIDHGNGYVTRYAHIDELFVSVGQKIRKGQQIASVGMTGRTTGPHLHFEIKKKDEFLDPKGFLNFN